MRRLILILLSMHFVIFPCMSQENDDVRKISELLAKEQEDLSEDELEHLSGFLKRQLALNNAGSDVLYASGIFTKYQVASLIDYRKRNGPCLSYLELASLDGFGDEFVSRIKPFVTLDYSPELKGRADSEFTARASLRSTQEKTRYGYTSRYKLNVGDFLKTSLACSQSLDANGTAPDAVCASVEVRLRKVPLRLAAGDFNARFGQGLTLWTGSDFTSLNSPSSFMKRHFGVTSSTSYSGNGTLTGLATELTVKNLSVSAYVAIPGIKTIKQGAQNLRVQPALNLNYAWRTGQAGVSHVMEFGGLGTEMFIPVMKTSCDLSLCVKGIDVFSELMFDWVTISPSAVAGIIFPIMDRWNMAALVQSHESEHKLALSSSMNDRKRIAGSMSTELTLYSVPKDECESMSLQWKFHSQWRFVLNERLQLSLRLTERMRSWGPMFRTDLRTDVSWQSDMFAVTLRLNGLQCERCSFLSYIEGGCKSGSISIYLRQGIFVVDDWEDRIYAYERDVPGAYNSPAFYGRGLWTSIMSSWKISDWFRLYFRAGYTAYPFMSEKKPGKAELRFQSVFDF